MTSGQTENKDFSIFRLWPQAGRPWNNLPPNVRIWAEGGGRVEENFEIAHFPSHFEIEKIAFQTAPASANQRSLLPPQL